MNWTETQRQLFEEITGQLGVQFDSESRLEIVQEPGYIDSPIAAHDFAAALLGAIGLATATIGQMRGLGSQAMRLDRRHAGLMLNSVAYHFQEGWQLDIAPVHTPVNDFYATKDGRHIVYNGAYSHLREGILQFLGCVGEHDSIAEATMRHDAQDLEDRLSELGLCAAIVRDREEWLAHPQGSSIADVPLIELTKIADGEPEPFSDDVFRPLEKLRVLEFARVLAGPTIGRTLADQGADVIHGRHPYLDHVLPFEVETGWGKKATYLDYSLEHDRALIFKLLETTDVLVDGLRPGAMAKAGLTVEELTRRKRNLICVQVDCYGFQGPWAGRRGWEQLAQACTGFASIHSANRDRLIPTSINQNPCAHFLRPMDMIFHGRSMSLFQAWQQMATISSYDLKIRLDSQLSRMNCQMFSTGFSSGALGGKGSSVMLAGTSSLPVVCHPARSRMSTGWAPDATWDEISSRCHCMALVLQRGRTRPAPTPRWGQMAPKI